MSEPTAATDPAQPQSKEEAGQPTKDTAVRREIGNSVQSTTSSSSKRHVSSLKGSRRESFARRSSEIFAAARSHFFRSRGQTGASVETLRGNTGADFEGFATVHRGDGGGMPSLLCCGKKDGLYFLLIKGYHCFVFGDEESKSPKYAIELMNRKAVIQPSHESFVPRAPHPGAGHDTTYTTIHLETGLGDVEYKFTFANMDDQLASKFTNAVSTASNDASTEQVRKRLGHEGLLSKRSSVRYADAIGAAKAKDQPDAPVGAGEVLAGMPAPGY
mmetsp:Transcript_38668/g.93106  ORF Transcript_38668/g.93106 Transcript_38668/m.93106 type:complete len:273 (-) Transcript_38668:339-1157(-)